MEKTIFCTAIVAALLTGCINMNEQVTGSGNISTENRQVSNAGKIKLTGDIDVYLQQGPVAVRVEADDNLLQYIETKMDDNWLEIKTREHVNINSSKPLRVYVTTPEIKALVVSGSGNIKSDHKFSTDDKVTLGISGSGDIATIVNAPKVEAHVSGSGNVHISGETKDVEVNISGSGNYDGEGLKAENANVSIAGSGDASLFADSRLKASVVGSGNVKYRGSATVDSHIAGSGTVSKVQ